LIILFLNIADAKKINTFLTLGYSQDYIQEYAYGYNISYGIDQTTSKSFYWSILFNLAYTKNQNDTISNYNQNLQLGYNLNKYTVYIIGSALTQTTHEIDGLGFGYGEGLRYNINHQYSLDIYHKSYNMVTKYNHYRYRINTISLKYNF
jgi:hypothetical protein